MLPVPAGACLDVWRGRRSSQPTASGNALCALRRDLQEGDGLAFQHITCGHEEAGRRSERLSLVDVTKQALGTVRV